MNKLNIGDRLLCIKTHNPGDGYIISCDRIYEILELRTEYFYIKNDTGKKVVYLYKDYHKWLIKLWEDS
jgi:hypothetical protein